MLFFACFVDELSKNMKMALQKLIENVADTSYFFHQLMLVVVNGVTQMHVENKLKFVISIL